MTATVETTPARRTAGSGSVRRGAAWLGGFVQRWVVFVIAVVAWELATRSADSPFFPLPSRADSPFFPPPSLIAVHLWQTWFDGPVSQVFLSDIAVDNLLPSLARMLGSWVIAVVIGVTLGIALGRSARALDYVGPLLAFFRAIPPPVLAPVFLLVFSLGAPMQIATIVFGVIWPVILNSIDGARSVDPTQSATARSFRLPRRRWVFGVVLPAALPKVFAGIRVSLSLALILMVISELLGATDGLGYQLNIAKNAFDYPGMWAVVVLLGVLGFLLNTILLAVERRVLRWQPDRK